MKSPHLRDILVGPFRLNRQDRRERFQGWVRDHSLELYQFAYRLCGDADTAEDLVQETFYEAWKGIAALRQVEKGRAWLFQVLRHRYAHWVRDESRRPPAATRSSVHDHEEQLEAKSPLPFNAIADRDTMQAAMNALDDRFRMPLLMVFLQGLTCQEAADQLDLPLGTVLSRIHRGRNHLRDVLSQLSGSLETGGHRSEIPGISGIRPSLRLGGDA